MEKIEPTTLKSSYTLADKDYLLIKAIQELIEAINKLSNKIN